MAIQESKGILSHAVEDKFLRIDGGNGASFFFPVGTYADWKRGLEFYRAVSRRAKAKKALLKFAYPVLKRRACLTAAEVAQVIAAELGMTELPKLDGHSPAMISPTRDKALVHHIGRSFEKFASKNSLPGVTGELELYRRLAEWQPRSFSYSRLLDFSAGASIVRFEMAYASGEFRDAPPELPELLEPLVEFFSLPGTATRSWVELWESLAIGVELPAEYRNGETPVGLVHRDFKPWNVKSGLKPLFFDFESAAMDGCPLEDLFNYYVEPRLPAFRADKLVGAVRRKVFPLAETLLRRLSISAEEVNRYWHWYLLERVSFWRTQGQIAHALLFESLYEHSR